MASRDENHKICQICGTELEAPIVWCERCGTPHHSDCWDYYGECSTYGCRSKKAAKIRRRVNDDIIIIGPPPGEDRQYLPRPTSGKAEEPSLTLAEIVFWPPWAFYRQLRKRTVFTALMLASLPIPILALLASKPLWFFYLLPYICLASYFYQEKAEPHIKVVEVTDEEAPVLVIEAPGRKKRKKRRKKSKRGPHHGQRKRRRKRRR